MVNELVSLTIPRQSSVDAIRGEELGGTEREKIKPSLILLLITTLEANVNTTTTMIGWLV